MKKKKTETTKKTGKVLRKMRDDKGLTREELSKYISRNYHTYICERTIERAEKGTNSRLDTLITISAALQEIEPEEKEKQCAEVLSMIVNPGSDCCTFGELAEYLRETKGWNHEKVRIEVRILYQKVISTQTIKNFEQGRNVTMETATLIIGALTGQTNAQRQNLLSDLLEEHSKRT